MVKKSIYIGFSDFFFKLSQKIDLNMSEYVEFYGDHVFLVQMIPNIAQISIFTNLIKNRIFYIYNIFYILKKKGPYEGFWDQNWLAARTTRTR